MFEGRKWDNCIYMNQMFFLISVTREDVALWSFHRGCRALPWAFTLIPVLWGWEICHHDVLSLRERENRESGLSDHKFRFCEPLLIFYGATAVLPVHFGICIVQVRELLIGIASIKSFISDWAIAWLWERCPVLISTSNDGNFIIFLDKLFQWLIIVTLCCLLI